MMTIIIKTTGLPSRRRKEKGSMGKRDEKPTERHMVVRLDKGEEDENEVK